MPKLTKKELAIIVDTTSQFIVKDKQNVKAVLENSKIKISMQIKSLEEILKQSSSNYCLEALHALKEGLQALEEVENMPSAAGRKKVIDDNEILAMRANGMTQEGVARKLNISTASVCRADKKHREGNSTK